MDKKLNDLVERIQKLIDKLECDGIEGPIEYLQEAKEDVERAIEEYERY